MNIKIEEDYLPLDNNVLNLDCVKFEVDSIVTKELKYQPNLENAIKLSYQEAFHALSESILMIINYFDDHDRKNYGSASVHLLMKQFSIWAKHSKAEMQKINLTLEHPTLLFYNKRKVSKQMVKTFIKHAKLAVQNFNNYVREKNVHTAANFDMYYVGWDVSFGIIDDDVSHLGRQDATYFHPKLPKSNWAFEYMVETLFPTYHQILFQ